MKKLTTTGIDHHGHTLTILDRTESLGLFSASYQGTSSPGYIVAKISQCPAATRIMPNGKAVTYDATESLPSVAEYGRCAWFFRCLESARIKFDDVREAQVARLTGKDRVRQGQGALTPALDGKEGV